MSYVYDDDLLRELSLIPCLPKPHVFGMYNASALDGLSDELLRMVAGITGHLCVAGDYVTRAQYLRVVRILAGVPQRPVAPDFAQLCILFKPFFRHWLPETVTDPADLKVEGYFGYLRLRIAALKEWSSAFPAKVILDTEKWKTKLDAPTWNDALRGRYEECQAIVTSSWPSAEVHWYNRNGTTFLFTMQETGFRNSLALYYADNQEFMAERYNAVSTASPAQPLTLWVSPGGTYVDGKWVGSNVYDPESDWHMGHWVNRGNFGPPDRLSPHANSPEVIVYGAPWGQPNYGAWTPILHYLRGATTP